MFYIHLCVCCVRRHRAQLKGTPERVNTKLWSAPACAAGRSWQIRLGPLRLPHDRLCGRAASAALSSAARRARRCVPSAGGRSSTCLRSSTARCATRAGSCNKYLAVYAGMYADK